MFSFIAARPFVLVGDMVEEAAAVAPPVLLRLERERLTSQVRLASREQKTRRATLAACTRDGSPPKSQIRANNVFCAIRLSAMITVELSFRVRGRFSPRAQPSRICLNFPLTRSRSEQLGHGRGKGRGTGKGEGEGRGKGSDDSQHRTALQLDVNRTIK